MSASASAREGRSRRVTRTALAAPPAAGRCARTGPGSRGRRDARPPRRAAWVVRRPTTRRAAAPHPRGAGVRAPELPRGPVPSAGRGRSPGRARVGRARPASSRSGAEEARHRRGPARAPATGRTGPRPPTSTPAPTATRAPALSARRASSVTRRVFPIPASPITSTTRPRPSRAQRQALISAASSAARPYIGRLRSGTPTDAVDPRSRASTARVAGDNPTPSSACSRAARSRSTTSAPARSPADAVSSARSR